MKIAVLSDIHAHLIGFQTVLADIERWQPDAVVVGGDIVNRGPRPAECWQMVSELQRTAGWHLLRGNHDDYVIHHAGQDDHTEVERQFYQATIWTAAQVKDQVSAIQALPEQVSLIGPDDTKVRIVHASMRHNRDPIFPHTSDDELREKIAPAPSVICMGHTHRPFVRQLDETLVVNVGSAGLPFDRDKRVSYARLEWRDQRWQAEIVRFAYDYQAAERDFYEAGFLSGGGPMVELILNELHYARGNLAGWAKKYEQAIKAGEISVRDSVQAYLAEVS